MPSPADQQYEVDLPRDVRQQVYASNAKRLIPGLASAIKRRT